MSDDITRRLTEQRNRQLTQDPKRSAPEDPKEKRRRAIAEVCQLTPEVLAKLKTHAHLEDWELRLVKTRRKTREIADTESYIGSMGYGSEIECHLWLLENGNYVNDHGDESKPKEIDGDLTFKLLSNLHRVLKDFTG